MDSLLKCDLQNIVECWMCPVTVPSQPNFRVGLCVSTMKYGTECVSRERQIILLVREQASAVLDRNMDTEGPRKWGWNSQSLFKGLYTIFAVIRHRNWWGEKMTRNRIWGSPALKWDEMRGITGYRHMCDGCGSWVRWGEQGSCQGSLAGQSSPKPHSWALIHAHPKVLLRFGSLSALGGCPPQASLISHGHVWNTALLVVGNNKLDDSRSRFLEFQILVIQVSVIMADWKF